MRGFCFFQPNVDLVFFWCVRLTHPRSPLVACRHILFYLSCSAIPNVLYLTFRCSHATALHFSLYLDADTYRQSVLLSLYMHCVSFVIIHYLHIRKYLMCAGCVASTQRIVSLSSHSIIVCWPLFDVARIFGPAQPCSTGL